MIEYYNIKLTDFQNKDGSQEFVGGLALVGLLGVAKGQVNSVDCLCFRRETAIRRLI